MVKYEPQIAERDQDLVNDYVLVRARRKQDLRSLFPDKIPTETPTADYRWRVVMTKDRFKKFLAEQVDKLEYPNFKNSIETTDHEYSFACKGVWHHMVDYQEGYYRHDWEKDSENLVHPL